MMTKEERKAQRKADKALLKAAIAEMTAAYFMEPDFGKWTALRIAAEKVVVLARQREGATGADAPEA